MADEMRVLGRFLLRGTRRAARTVIGFALVAVGLAGLLLPVLPGWVLIIAGLAVLSREYSWARSGLDVARRQAARGGAGLRNLVRRGRTVSAFPAEVDMPRDIVLDLDREVVLDLAEAVDVRELEGAELD